MCADQQEKILQSGLIHVVLFVKRKSNIDCGYLLSPTDYLVIIFGIVEPCAFSSLWTCLCGLLYNSCRVYVYPSGVIIASMFEWTFDMYLYTYFRDPGPFELA